MFTPVTPTRIWVWWRHAASALADHSLPGSPGAPWREGGGPLWGTASLFDAVGLRPSASLRVDDDRAGVGAGLQAVGRDLGRIARSLRRVPDVGGRAIDACDRRLGRPRHLGGRRDHEVRLRRVAEGLGGLVAVPAGGVGVDRDGLPGGR